MATLTDPCGNPIPIPIDVSFYVPTPPSIPDLLNLLGIDLPTIDADVPCPILLDRAADAAKGGP